MEYYFSGGPLTDRCVEYSFDCFCFKKSHFYGSKLKVRRQDGKLCAVINDQRIKTPLVKITTDVSYGPIICNTDDVLSNHLLISALRLLGTGGWGDSAGKLKIFTP